MAEIINLRRARKSKSRAVQAAEVASSRVKHGVAKPVRALAKARRDKDKRTIEAHRLDDEK